MLPIPPQPVEDTVPSDSGLSTNAVPQTADTEEKRAQKPKTLPCKYCSKKFRRVEHVQRHERTHTKEKPFACEWDRCGKTFGRRDLLVRHEKLVHLNETPKESERPPSSSAATSGSNPQAIKSPQDSLPTFFGVNVAHDASPSQQQDVGHDQSHRARAAQGAPFFFHPMTVDRTAGAPFIAESRDQAGRMGAGNLDLLSDAALATQVTAEQPVPNNQLPKPLESATGNMMEPLSMNQERARNENYPFLFGAPMLPDQMQFDDYNPFLDELANQAHVLPSNFEPDQQLNLWMRLPQASNAIAGSKTTARLPSRFGPSMPDTSQESDSRPGSLRLSSNDYTTIKAKVEDFAAVLPAGFSFPSRHTLTRFSESYVSGFHDSLPFLHLPTLSLVHIAPELLLAILSVGAYYRYENNRGTSLWYGARAIALEQIRRRHSMELQELLRHTGTDSPLSTKPSPKLMHRHSFGGVHTEHWSGQNTTRQLSFTSSPTARLETIQAVLLLYVNGLWGPKPILQDSLMLQGVLAVLIREDGLHAQNSQASLDEWEIWVRREGALRTKLIAFCFFNLCSMAYNLPPQMVTSELHLGLPSWSRLWRAGTSWQWQELRQTVPNVDVTIQDTFSRLLGRSSQAMPAQMSSLASYVLLHAILQHLCLVKQISHVGMAPFETRRTLKTEDSKALGEALRIWQLSFEQRQQARAAELGQSAPADVIGGSSIAQNATALLRLACIRLYSDLPIGRALETRDSALVALTLSSMPPVARDDRLHRAVFQAIHALSILVKVGVNYVARAKAAEWSVQHALCNFECAVLLAQWLLTLASTDSGDAPASSEEKNLLHMVRRMIDETEFSVLIDTLDEAAPSHTQTVMSTAKDRLRLKQMAVAVMRLWAETFKGTHVFDAAKIMGAGLDGYADLVGRAGVNESMLRVETDAMMT